MSKFIRHVSNDTDFAFTVAPYLVGQSRCWNNSMYFYEDSAICFVNGEVARYSLGIDFWDAHNSDKIIAQTSNSVQLAYRAYQMKRAQDAQDEATRAQAETLAKFISSSKLTEIEAKRLYAAYSGDTLAAIRKLLTSALRSPFRKSIAQQIRTWLADPSPKYHTPLSSKQLSYITTPY